MGSVVIYPPSPDILQRSRERAVKGRNARRLRRLALDGLARLCYFRQGGGGISSRAAPFPMNGKGRGDMKTINLRWIYPHYRHDEFVEVSDEVWEAMRQAQREMNNYERRKVYHRAWYSLDAYSWAENYALEHGRSPEEILLEREERAARLRLVAALPEALSHTTPTQARRVRAYYIAGINQPQIAQMEGVHSSKVSIAIRRGLRNMRRCYDGLFPSE